MRSSAVYSVAGSRVSSTVGIQKADEIVTTGAGGMSPAARPHALALQMLVHRTPHKLPARFASPHRRTSLMRWCQRKAIIVRKSPRKGLFFRSNHFITEPRAGKRTDKSLHLQEKAACQICQRPFKSLFCCAREKRRDDNSNDVALAQYIRSIGSTASAWHPTHCPHDNWRAHHFGREGLYLRTTLRFRCT